MINELVIDTLKPLNIPVVYLKFDTIDKPPVFILFSIFNEFDSDFADDESESETYYVQITLWYTDGSSYDYVDQIKALMKKAGFILDSASDVFNENNYGKNLDFVYKNFL